MSNESIKDLVLFDIEIRLYTLLLGKKGFYRCLAKQILNHMRKTFKTPENLARHFTAYWSVILELINYTITDEMLRCLTDEERKAVEKTVCGSPEYIS